MVLLRNDGKNHEEIIDFISYSYRSVAYWCIHGNPDDLESFKDGRAQGNYRKATPECIAELLSVIKQEPIVFGYKFGRWTTGPRILIVLDNASYHKKQTIIDQLANECPNLER